MKEYRERKKSEDPEAFKQQERERTTKKRLVRQADEDAMRRHSELCRLYKLCNPKGKLIAYKAAARHRGIEWKLTDEEAVMLFRLSCHYCGLPPNPLNGIDRKDNEQCYEKPNVVPCCTTCNYAKHVMSYAEFLGWIDRVVAYRKALKMLD